MDQGSSRLRVGLAAPIVRPSESLLVSRSTLKSTQRSTRHSFWARLLLYCGVFYICGLVALLVYMQLLLPPNALGIKIAVDDFHLSSNFRLDAAAIAKAEEHARNVKMLPQGRNRLRKLRCIGWRAADSCSPHGSRLPHLDKPCHVVVADTQSGYCEVEDKITKERFRVMRRYCRSVQPKSQFRCLDAQDFVNFPVQANLSMSKALVPSFALPNIGEGGEGSKGIVMVLYPKIVPSAYASIRALKEVLECDLLIELWYRKKEMDMVPGSMAPLQQLASLSGGISFHEIDDNKAIGFGAKVFAVYHSYFKNVLFLDSDNVPVRDPSFLFETQEYQDTGALFWPDFWHPRHTIFNIHGQSLLWELLDQRFVNMFEQESGQLVIDRRRHAAPLELVNFYTFHTPNFFQTFKLAHGDKDLFRLAWLKLESPFYMIDSLPAVAGKALNNSFCGVTMVQHDANGNVLFLHRNTRKLIGEPQRRAVHLRSLAAQKGEQQLLHTRPSGRTNSAMEELRNVGATAALTLDAPKGDNYPDAIYWTHLLVFRNTSKRIHYKIDVHQALQGFTKGQACYGVTDMVEKNQHFFFRAFADFSFRGLETQLRKFAMEAAEMVHANQNVPTTSRLKGLFK